MKKQDIQKGKGILNKWFEDNIDQKLLINKDNYLEDAINDLNIVSIENLYLGLGSDTISINSVTNKLLKIIY